MYMYLGSNIIESKEEMLLALMEIDTLAHATYATTT